STGFMLYFRGGFQSMIKKRIKLNAIEFNLNDYDLIIIGTPVWAWRLNPVVRSFLRTSKFQNKKFGLFCCCGDSGANILKEMREILKGNEILGEIEFIEPLKNETELSIDRAKQWVKGLNKL
ncbi:MAG: flavodoxin, partial [Asgard group archaeon]|nr:flavodoxin [Asgard group archaeon]